MFRPSIRWAFLVSIVGLNSLASAEAVEECVSGQAVLYCAPRTKTPSFAAAISLCRSPLAKEYKSRWSRCAIDGPPAVADFPATCAESSAKVIPKDSAECGRLPSPSGVDVVRIVGGAWKRGECFVRLGGVCRAGNQYPSGCVLPSGRVSSIFYYTPECQVEARSSQCWVGRPVTKPAEVGNCHRGTLGTSSVAATVCVREDGNNGEGETDYFMDSRCVNGRGGVASTGAATFSPRAVAGISAGNVVESPVSHVSGNVVKNLGPEGAIQPADRSSPKAKKKKASGGN